jgi:preprotein translocase subunit SecE
VARDRQRAKQRKARRAQTGAARPAPTERADGSGGLDHASGEVDEFEAALVHGAGGQPADATDAADAFDEQEAPDAGQEAPDAGQEAPDAGQEAFGEVEEDDDIDEELEQAAVAAAPAERRDVVAQGAPGAPTRRGAGRFIGFLRASWAELQRVQWPDRRQVTQATAVVVGFVVVAGFYLGVADWVAKKIVDYII